MDFAEKMKEKDIKIIQLQNDLLKSQEIINDSIPDHGLKRSEILQGNLP